VNQVVRPRETFFHSPFDEDLADGFLKRVAEGVLKGPMSDGREGSALHIAAGKGDDDVCHRLIGYGADIWMLDRSRELAIHRAASSGYISTCRLLLDAAGAERDRMLAFHAGSGYTPFQLSALHGRLDLMTFFVLECGEDPTQRTSATNRRLTAYRNPRQMDAVEDLLKALASEVSIRREIGLGSSGNSALSRTGVCPGLL
jgi:hypothetical protein